ncbi:DUF3592 domain-containing protein [Spirosoma montaniterrae]|uniref:DUF3592 domain-containing protein n=1 Tax=Spirosoma montaniterrae TaxID=1178516 RepID=A0A1P9WW39_9BACT|nr:DUF3592 domain-containing protein [Spirosoma montaniterrae]AQG79596.1 hypothetical protein AWR27_09820 [Spirosoma montaniterrae]
MTGKDKAWLGFCLLFAGVGTLFAIIAYRSWDNTYSIVRNGIQTQGVVIENRYKERINLKSRSTAMAPVVQFRTADGMSITYYSQTYTSPVQAEVGETVSIWYMPNNPQEATLEGVDAWLLPVVFGIFGVVFGLIGYSNLLPLLLSTRKNRSATHSS